MNIDTDTRAKLWFKDGGSNTADGSNTWEYPKTVTRIRAECSEDLSTGGTFAVIDIMGIDG